MASQTLRFGRRGSWSAEWKLGSDWRVVATPTDPPLDDPAAAIGAALQSPFEFPPLGSAVIPGDRVAIALGRDIPQIELLLAGFLAELERGEVQPESVTVLYPAGEQPITADPASRLRNVRHVVHTPDDRSSLSYLAASAAARPIYFSKWLCDADVVIPMGCAGPSREPSAMLAASPLFPTYADHATLERLREGLAAGLTAVDVEREADEAAWLLGVQFAVDIVRGPAGRILSVLAGERVGIGQRSRKAAESAWRQVLPYRADLVVGTVRQMGRASDWRDLARALETMIPLANPDGSIVLMSDLEAPPSVPVRSDVHAGAASDVGSAASAALGELSCAAVLAQLPADMRVYLVSALPAATVEEAGLIPIETEAELRRLVASSTGGILIEEADHAVVELDQQAGVSSA